VLPGKVFNTILMKTIRAAVSGKQLAVDFDGAAVVKAEADEDEAKPAKPSKPAKPAAKPAKAAAKAEVKSK
jgi:hypothetical protein